MSLTDAEKNRLKRVGLSGLNKPKRTSGGKKKFVVYTKKPAKKTKRNPKGYTIVKVGFGQPGMKISKNAAARKSFLARHKCDTNPGPKWKARYWSCKAW